MAKELMAEIHDDANGILRRSDMTLRDCIAAQALLGMLAHQKRYKPRQGTSYNWHDAISEEAYEIADAMLEARK